MPGTSTSVIIPVLNGASFIKDAITSALQQIADDDEIIVIDDGSTDATDLILRQFQPRIVVLQGDKRGPSAARNKGLMAAKGDFLAFLDHDDFWPPERHAAFLHTFSSVPDCDAVTGRIRILAIDGVDAGPYSSWDGKFEPRMLSTCLFSRALINIVGLFDETIRHGEDNDFFVRLNEAGMKLQHCDVDALYYRRHTQNMTNSAPHQTATMMDLVLRKMKRRRAADAAANLKKAPEKK